MAYGVVGAALVPHPPIVLPEVGGADSDRVSATRTAMGELARWIASLKVDTLVLIDPHGPALRGEIPMAYAHRAAGNLAQFRAPDVAVDWPVDTAFTRELASSCAEAGIPVRSVDRGEVLQLDHGAVVPLRLMDGVGLRLPLVCCGMPFVERDTLRAFGGMIHHVARDCRKRVVTVASGDLSHRLTAGAPSGYDPRGEEFDRAIVRHLAEGEADEIFSISDVLVERAGQCGYNPLLVALGSLADRTFHGTVHSYEGPFGVGYAVVGLAPEDEDEQAGGPVELAEQSLRHYLDEGEVMQAPSCPPRGLQNRGGTFVTLKKDGRLRGCMGTVEPTEANAASEIIRNAISAGVRDPRFPPVTSEELPSIEFAVDVLDEPEAVSGIEDLDPARYGVVVSRGARRGVLLPGLEGVDTPERQLEIACQKADLSPRDPGLRIQRFEVRRYSSH